MGGGRRGRRRRKGGAGSGGGTVLGREGLLARTPHRHLTRAATAPADQPPNHTHSPSAPAAFVFLSLPPVDTYTAVLAVASMRRMRPRHVTARRSIVARMSSKNTCPVLPCINITEVSQPPSTSLPLSSPSSPAHQQLPLTTVRESTSTTPSPNPPSHLPLPPRPHLISTPSPVLQRT